MLNTTSIQGYIECCEAIKEADLSMSTQLIKNPTLVLVGSNDLSTPPEQVQSTANLIKNSKFHVIKNLVICHVLITQMNLLKLLKIFFYKIMENL